MEEIELFLDDAKDTMEKALKHLAIELTKIRAGKANTGMLDGIQVEYYGMLSPLHTVAAIILSTRWVGPNTARRNCQSLKMNCLRP